MPLTVADFATSRPKYQRKLSRSESQNVRPSGIAKQQKGIRRMSSTNWDTPYRTDSKNNFAEIKTEGKMFRAKINLDHFDSFERDEIDVSVHNNDLHIHAESPHPENPNRPQRVFNRQYRLPDDLDVRTLKINRDTDEMSLQAKKLSIIKGQPLTLAIADATKPQKVEQRARL